MNDISTNNTAHAPGKGNGRLLIDVQYMILNKGILTKPFPGIHEIPVADIGEIVFHVQIPREEEALAV